MAHRSQITKYAIKFRDELIPRMGETHMTPTKPNPWNWLTFLKSAVKKEPDLEQSFRAAYLARTWSTCACGELCKSLPRNSRGQPVDRELSDLGQLFFNYVICDRWSSALSVFLKIEARTAKLLKAGPANLEWSIRNISVGKYPIENK